MLVRRLNMARFWEFAQLTDGWKNASYFDEVPLLEGSSNSEVRSAFIDESDEEMRTEKQQGRLYIGGIAGIYQDPSPLKKAGVTHVVSLLDWEIDEEGRRKVEEVVGVGEKEKEGSSDKSALEEDDDDDDDDEKKWLQIDIEDDESQNLAKWFKRTNAFIHRGLREGGGVFVHCAMGVSRSATIICAYLMWRFGVGRDEALEWLRRGRGRCNPSDGFWEQLGVYEKALQEERKGNQKSKL